MASLFHAVTTTYVAGRLRLRRNAGELDRTAANRAMSSGSAGNW